MPITRLKQPASLYSPDLLVGRDSPHPQRRFPTQDSNLSIQSTQNWDAARAYDKLSFTMTTRSLPIQELREPLLSCVGLTAAVETDCAGGFGRIHAGVADVARGTDARLAFRPSAYASDWICISSLEQMLRGTEEHAGEYDPFQHQTDFLEQVGPTSVRSPRA